MGNQYGSYAMYFLSNLLQKQSMMNNQSINNQRENSHNQRERGVADSAEPGLFEDDETGAKWHREEKLDLLEKFCPEALESAEKYGHFIIGEADGRNFIGIPGRFMLSEQPAQGSTGFTLWQPLRGGELFYGELETISDEAAEQIFGYWIAVLDAETLAISEFL